MARDPAVARAVGRDVIALRKQQGEMATQFAGVFTALTGETPSGIAGFAGAGLGAAPIVIAAWAGAVIVGLLAAFGAFWLSIQNTKAKAALITEQNRAALLAAAAAKAAAGDQAGADVLRRQAGVPGTVDRASQNFQQWFEDNWLLVAGAVALITVGPYLARR